MADRWDRFLDRPNVKLTLSQLSQGRSVLEVCGIPEFVILEYRKVRIPVLTSDFERHLSAQ